MNKNDIRPQHIYRNKKNKCLYRVLHIGKHTETEEEMVVYKLIDNHAMIKKHIWIRPLALFAAKFERINECG